MPAVPYKGYPEVEPTGAGLPNVRVSTPIEAFGGGIGQAIGHLGKTIEGAGDELWRRAVALQEVRNKADAEAAETQYMKVAGDLHVQYNSLQGKAAVDANAKYNENLDNARIAIRDGLGNDYTKRLYDSASRGIMGRHIFNGSGHAAAQNKAYIGGASAARIAAHQDYVMHNPGDVSAYEDGVKLINTEVRGTQAPLAGWSPEQADEEARKAVSNLTAARIVGLARTQPLQAKEMFEQLKGRLYGPDLDKVDKAIGVQTRTIGSRIGAQESGALDPSIPLEKVQEEGAKWAAKNFPDDPAMGDFVRQRIIIDRGQVKSAKREKDYDNSEIMADALVGVKSGGRRPASLEELVAADPRVAQIWEQLPAREQNKYLEAFAHNAKDPYMMTPERAKQVQILKGMAADGDNDAREKFMYTNIPSLELPDSSKRELIALQKHLRKNLEGDPRTLRALRDLAPMMHAARLEKKINEDDYYQFRGGLQDALDDYQKRNPGKTPTYDEIKEIGSRLIQDVGTPSRWFDDPKLAEFFSGKVPMFRVPVPEEESVKIKAAFFADKGRNPTEEEEKRWWIMKKYQELYGEIPLKKLTAK